MPSVERLKAFLSQDPTNPELACDLIDAQFAAGDIAGAHDTFAALPDALQGLPGLRFRLARIALTSGDYSSAESELQRLAEQGHDSAAVGHDQAFAALCMRQPARANAIIARTETTFGPTPELHILSARVALMENQYDVAQQRLDAALALEPDSATALGLRALALLDAGDAAAAQQAAVVCLSHHPDQHEALLAAGTLSLWAGQLPTATTLYERALSRFPNSGRALSGMGQIHALGGQLESALSMLQRAAHAMPQHIGSWHALGWVQLLLGDLPAAGQSYRTAYDLDRNFADSHGGLAVVALLEQRFEEGEASMKRAIKLDPQSVSGRYAQSLWLRHQGRDAEADALFGELIGASALPGLEGLDAGEMAERLRRRATTPPSPRG